MKLLQWPDQLNPNTSGLIIDLDETLIPLSSPYYANGRQREWEAVAGLLETDVITAKDMIRRRREHLAAERHLPEITMTEAVLSFGGDMIWWNEVRENHCFRPEEDITQNDSIRRSAEVLREHFPHFVVASSSPQGLVERCVRTIGLDHVVTLPWGVAAGKRPKYDHRYFPAICDHIGLRPNQCIAIGDRREVDCEAPLRAGFAGAIWLDEKHTIESELANAARVIQQARQQLATA